MKMTPIMTNVVTAIVTAVILGIGGWALGVFNAGSTALSEDQIEAVVNKIMVTAAGKSIKARIAEVDGQLIGLETRVGIALEDIDDLEDSVRDLSRE